MTYNIKIIAETKKKNMDSLEIVDFSEDNSNGKDNKDVTLSL